MAGSAPETHPRRRKRRLAASHQRSWLWGRHAVTATLAARRWPVTELLCSEKLSVAELTELRQLAAAAEVQPQPVSDERMTQLCGSHEHQGLLALMAEFPCGQIADLRRMCQTRLSVNRSLNPTASLPLVVICDRIQDPHNLGAILRCCEGAGADAVLLGIRDQAGVTPHVARASAGAVNYLNLYRLEDLPAAAAELKSAGIRLVAASEKSADSLWDCDLSGPVGVVIGSETSGIRPELLDQCDVKLRIPMFGRTTSLNAAVAAGIAIYEIRRQQRQGG